MQREETVSDPGSSARNLLAYGYSLALLGSIFFSLSALFILLISANGVEDWTIIFLQTILTSATALVYTVVISESFSDFYSKFQNIGLLGLLAVVLLSIEGIAFILAILYTNVANVYIILVCNPLISAALGRVVFGEHVPWRTVITIVVCMTTILTVVGLEMSSSLDSSWFGNVMAATATFTLASYVVTMRGANQYRSPETPEIELGVVVFLGFGISAIASLFAGAANHLGEMTNLDWLYITLMGVVEYPTALISMGTATKHILASEVGVYLLVDAVLGPLWVYLAGLEPVQYDVLYGGIVVLSALLFNSVAAMYEEKEQKHEYTELPHSEPDPESASTASAGGSGSSSGQISVKEYHTEDDRKAV